jgi:hypothetical protein
VGASTAHAAQSAPAASAANDLKEVMGRGAVSENPPKPRIHADKIKPEKHQPKRAQRMKQSKLIGFLFSL